ncbi:MAG: squalene/phytoene synthase family protein [Chloroflexi bacterium]|nr:squalene/phytoene synthase family protein [Chloroflexota bacterium]
MTDTTAALAKSITWASSKQTYYTASLMVDRDLVNDCYRAYAYFRWADDIIDISSQSAEERTTFIQQQRALIDRLYEGERPNDLTPEEEMIADLIMHDRADNADSAGRSHPGESSGLQFFIRNFLAVIEFDAYRKGRLISQEELTWYANCLGKSVTDGILYFIGNSCLYPTAENRYLAATAAHITHMLRDMVSDITEGYINIPREYLEAHAISPEDVSSPPFRAWVQSRVEQARQYLYEGKRYLDELDVLRCKIAGYWYCVRFETVLDAIERDGYILRAVYNERRKLSTWLRMVWCGVSVALQHVIRQVPNIILCKEAQS